jgi:transcription initiation factor TFIIIB Brf1 subunit/transcription initiation factor TFIIB
MRDFDLHRWFAPGELEQCPACREEAGIRLPESGSFLCLDCGHVQASEVDAEAQVSPAEPV